MDQIKERLLEAIQGLFLGAIPEYGESRLFMACVCKTCEVMICI